MRLCSCRQVEAAAKCTYVRTHIHVGINTDAHEHVHVRTDAGAIHHDDHSEHPVLTYEHSSDYSTPGADVQNYKNYMSYMGYAHVVYTRV